MIAVVDYGCGNLHSVAKAFDAIGEDVVVTAEPDVLRSADRIVIPGVGNFGAAMKKFRSSGLVDCLTEQVRVAGKPTLGICVGMQLMADRGLEGGETAGLGWAGGIVDRLPARNHGLRLPHVGWNEVFPVAEPAIFKGLGKAPVFYFVHSYALGYEGGEGPVAAWCDYGEQFVAAVQFDNVVATQFHPEKSQDIGLRFLMNWVDWSP
ncbi:MAG: imidazole glycerol phosphate synthase subunit HisH [Chloroflexi bacterium]|nr:imidazole glycerol phosphate synthase subunit HisH [Chloroflexota bacterium]